jgi:lysyl endopeptidase
MRRILTIALLLSFACVALAAAPIRSVPPATSITPARAKAQAVLRLQAATAPLVISLSAPTAAELAEVQVRSASANKLKPLSIGFGRDVPEALRNIALGTLEWQGTADGGRAAQVVVASPGAAALRVALQMQQTDPDIVIRLQGDDPRAKAMGPFAANEIAEATGKVGEWWSPVLEGSRATIEIAVSADVDVSKVTLTLSRISHLTRAGAALAPGASPKATGIGASGSCEINWVCEAPTAALNGAANAVARMVFTAESGMTFLCTGTLVNDSISSQTPYFFTANHCIDSAYAAQTLNVYWFYDAASCDSPETPVAYVLQHGGSTLLGRSNAEDWALVRLNQPPPAGTTFSAWNADPITSGPVIDLHHPEGDLKKFSAGSLNGYESVQIDNEDTGDPQINAFLARVFWNQGVTEGGSSGSGLLTYLASGGYYELRGGLTGGQSSCSAQHSPDYYSRFDQMLPKMRDYLAPGTNPPNEAVVVEYYNSVLDHYFMTASPDEINDLDTGAFVGWQRTGLRFLAYTSQVPGTSPVCRFYLAPGFGDSHFYSASPSECSSLVNNPQFPGWIFESGSVFYIALPNPVTGACAAGTHPLWRFFHSAVTNHRYTDDVSERDILRADPAWIPEGYGPDAVTMCAPNGN